MELMPDALDNLASTISKGLNEKSPDLLASVKALFGTRYYQNDWKSDDGLRNRYAMGEDGVPFGALLHPGQPVFGCLRGLQSCLVPIHFRQPDDPGRRHTRAATRRRHSHAARS